MKKCCVALLLLSMAFSALSLPAYADSYDRADYQYRFKDGEIVREAIPDERQLLKDEYSRQRQEANGDISVHSGDGKTVTKTSLGGELFNTDKVRGQLETAILALEKGQDTVVLRLVNLSGNISQGDFIILRDTASNAGLKLELYVDYVIDGKVVTRSYLNKNNMDSGYELGVDDLELSGIKSMVARSFSNDTILLYVGENGGNVKVAQRLPETMNKADLHLYSYNPTDNSYKLTALKNINVDDGFYSYFTVYGGGYYFVSDGIL